MNRHRLPLGWGFSPNVAQQPTTRNHPTAHAIADALHPDMLRLSTTQLISDIRTVYGCGESTAVVAVGIARRRSELSPIAPACAHATTEPTP